MDQLKVREIIKEYKETGNKELEKKIFSLHMGIAETYAWFYISKIKSNSISYKDLVSEGYSAIKEALDDFDLKKYPHSSFAPYLKWRIKNNILNFINDSKSTIREPRHIQSMRNNMKKIPSALKSDREIAEYLGKEEDTISNYKKPPLFVSFDDQAYKNSDDDSETLEETIKDENTDVYGDAEARLIKQDMEEELKKLTPREREIIERRFLYAKDTLEEIGEDYNLSRERIRQIEKKALEKLKKKEKIRAWHEPAQF